MVVCHCHAVTDREICASVRGGCTTPEEVCRATRAGTGCGGCRPHVEQLVRLQASREERGSLLQTWGIPA